MGDVSSISKGLLDFPQCTENGDVVVDGRGNRTPLNQYFPPTIEDLPDNSPPTGIFAPIIAWVDESPTLPIRFGRSVAATIFLPPSVLAGCWDIRLPDVDPNKDKDNDTFSFCNAGDAVDECDCDDSDENINPDAQEVCDGVDNNCDGSIDEGVTNTYYLDADGDKYGDPANPSKPACSAPEGYVDNNEDCDGADGEIYPGADEICDADNIDEDCDGLADDQDTEGASGKTAYHVDNDGDGFGTPNEPTEDFCDLSPGHSATNDDCDDTDPALNPAHPDDCGVPVLTFPSDGATLSPTRAYLSWYDTPWAGKTVQGYEVCYDNSISSGSCSPTSLGQTLNMAAVIDPLDEDEVYIWQVRAQYTDGTESALSSAYTFVTDASVVAWYNFDTDEAGIEPDWSGNNNTGDWTGHPLDGTPAQITNGESCDGQAPFTEGILGAAVCLDGEDDYLEVPDQTSLDMDTTVSVTARVSPEVYDGLGEKVILSKGVVGGGNGVTYGMSMVAEAGQTGAYFYIGSPFCYVTNTMVGAENWHFVAGSYDETTTDRICYMDGLTGTDNTTAPALTPNNASLRIGSDSSANRFFSGLIDEVALYNVALSEEEILNSYCAIETLILGATDTLPSECP